MRLDGWDEQESVVTHLRTLDNLRSIHEHGLSDFLQQQQERIGLLKAMLNEFDDGRSKGYCCLAAALLPLDVLEVALKEARRGVENGGIPADDRKSRAGTLRRILDFAAERLGVSLKLRK